MVAADTPEANAPSLEEVKRQRDDFYDRLLRKTAEFDNFRKRMLREQTLLVERANESLIEQLLPVLDDWVLDACGAARPRVMFLPTAGGDNPSYVTKFVGDFDNQHYPELILSS